MATSAQSLAGLRGACRKYGHPEPEGLEGEIFLARVEREITRLARIAPELTEDQRQRLAMLSERLAS